MMTVLVKGGGANGQAEAIRHGWLVLTSSMTCNCVASSREPLFESVTALRAPRRLKNADPQWTNKTKLLLFKFADA